MDFSSAITAGSAGVVADFTTNVAAIFPVLLGLGFVALIARRTLGLARR